MASSDDQQRPTPDAVFHLIKGRCTKGVEQTDLCACEDDEPGVNCSSDPLSDQEDDDEYDEKDTS